MVSESMGFRVGGLGFRASGFEIPWTSALGECFFWYGPSPRDSKDPSSKEYTLIIWV